LSGAWGHKAGAERTADVTNIGLSAERQISRSHAVTATDYTPVSCTDSK